MNTKPAARITLFREITPPIIGLSFLLTVLLSGTVPAAEPATLWITSDLEGYLIGCDCPTGTSAGLSAIDSAIGDRNPENGILMDAGGFREPFRSDPLLEGFLDEAALMPAYSGIIATAADFRDGMRSFARRSHGVPLSVAGGVSDSRFLKKIAGEGGPLILEDGGVRIAVGHWNGKTEENLIEEITGGRLDSVPATEVLEFLSDAEADFRILVIRGSFEEWMDFSSGDSDLMGLLPPDLLMFTGPESPGAELAMGADSGTLLLDSHRIPWFSLAPRGNGLAGVVLDGPQSGTIRIIPLERGISPESPRILSLGENYMDALVRRALEASGRSVEESEDPSEVLETRYWYPYGCRDCEDFLRDDVPALERKNGKRISIVEFDTGNPSDFETLLGELESRDVRLEQVPVMIIGGTILQGGDAIKDGLAAIMNESASSSSVPASPGAVRWEPGAIFLAGLLDGVNPCAFSAMVFLVSALALAGRSRRTMLAIGLFYAAGIFITYGLIGAGLLGGLRRIAVESGIRDLLEYFLAALLILLAILSLADGIRLARGRDDLLLKLPKGLSKRVHRIIRNSVRSGAAAGGSFLLGAGVALIELGCTGQVYLPTIAWMISRGGGSTPWFWLLIYNMAFIIPLMIVFVVSYKGVSSVKLAGAFKQRGSIVKYATAGLFAVLAALVFFV